MGIEDRISAILAPIKSADRRLASSFRGQEGVEGRVRTEKIDDNPSYSHNRRATRIQAICEQGRDTCRDVDDGKRGPKIVQPTPVSQQLLCVPQLRQSALILNLLVDDASRHRVGLYCERLDSCRQIVMSVF